MIKTARKWSQAEVKRAQELTKEGYPNDLIAATLNANFRNNRNAKSVYEKLWKIEKEKRKPKFTAKIGKLSNIHMKSSPEIQSVIKQIAYLENEEAAIKQLKSEQYHKLAQLQG